MEFNVFKNTVKQKRGTIFSISFLLVALVMIISLLGGLKYTAKSNLLVVQDTGSADAYMVSRSNEYLGNLLSQVVYSGSFFNSVIENRNYRVSSEYFGSSYSERMKNWRKTIYTKTISDTGIIEVYVYHSNPDQARMISLAVNDVLINDNAKYHSGRDVKVSILDQPLVSEYPDNPNLVTTFLITLILSLFVSLIYIYLYPEKKYDISLWPKSSGLKKIKKEKVRKMNNSYTQVTGPIKLKVETDKGETERINDIRTIKTEDEVKKEMEEKDIFSPKGDIDGVLR